MYKTIFKIALGNILKEIKMGKGNKDNKDKANNKDKKKLSTKEKKKIKDEKKKNK